MPTKFLLTKSPALLAQYFELRNRVYLRHYPHLPVDFGCEEPTDRHSHIVVGYDSRVVAGGRITISRPAQLPHSGQRHLPMEEAGFRLAAAVPRFRLDREPYAEFSRVAVDPGYAGGRHCSLGLIKELAHSAALHGVDLVFSICPEAQVRWNALNSRKCGVTFQTFPEIAIPTPFRIPMTLCAYTGLVAADCQPLGLSA
jgi:hypothetical protein